MSIRTISIVGAGFMGTQIGLRCATHGYIVWLIDVSTEVLNRASQTCILELEARHERQEITIEEKEAISRHIHFTTDMKEGVSDSDLVIEAVPEHLEIKRTVFAQLDLICPNTTILATNSSSFSISKIEGVTHRLDKVLNTHFYARLSNSAQENTVVELMHGKATSDETMNTLRQFIFDIGAVPLLVRKESTGFIFNRVWRAIKKECLRVVEEGVASHEDVDRAWMVLMDKPIGPFGLMDVVGLDVVRDIEMVYYLESGDESDAPSKILLDRIERGWLGIKTGKGFYKYPNPTFQEPSWLKGINE